MFTGFIVLSVEIICILLLAVYLSQVVPSEFGQTKPWHYPVSMFMKQTTKMGVSKLEEHIGSDDNDDAETEDDDVRKERMLITNEKYEEDIPLVVRGMRKEYDTFGGAKKIAVKDISLKVEANTEFGLLGPNGAGKTSLISILTGVYSPTRGDAALGGFSIRDQSEYAFRSIGVCPQARIFLTIV